MPKTVSPPEVEKETSEQLTPLYHVVLLDDDDHTYDYVIEMLQHLFLKSNVDAYQHAVEVDTIGRTVVITCELSEAEFGRDQIQAYGADWRMPKSKGSMRAVVEPASGHPDVKP
jgi:ATP-dependent Clp protease adaptor protein ClpS